MTDRLDVAGLVDELHWLERHAVGDSLGVQPRACKVAREAASVLIALQAENERLAKDAARYRWLRDTNDATYFSVRKETEYPNQLYGPALDAAIDAALASGSTA